MKEPLKIDDPSYLEQLKSIKLYPNHLHWDGSIPADYIMELSRRRDRKILLPLEDIEGWPIKYDSEEERAITDAESLSRFQKNLRQYRMFDVFRPALMFMQTKEDLIDMAVFLTDYLRSRNIYKCETRFAPQFHLEEGLDPDRVIGYAIEGFKKGFEKNGVGVKLIISVDRSSDVSVTSKIIDAALHFPGDVVGVDLACEERGNPPEKHYEAFKKTFDSPLKRTYHAGEMCSEEENLKNIHTCLTLMRADGIGHAIPLWRGYYKTHDLFELMRKNNVRLESNPVSNYNFFIEKISDLHLDILIKNGILVTINPDDPAMWEFGDPVYPLYFTGMLYGPEFVMRVLENAWKTAFGD